MDALDESREELAREAAMLFSVAENHLSERAHEDAEQSGKEALALFRELGDKTGVADTLRLLVGAMRVREALAAAEALAVENLERFVEADDRNGEAAMMLTLVELDRDTRGGNAYESVLRTGMEALSIFREMRNQKMEATTLLAIGELYGVHTKTDLMMRAAKEALRIYRQVEDQKGEAHALHSIAVCHSLSEGWEDAQKQSSLARNIFQEVGASGPEASELQFMATCHFQLKDYKTCLANAEEAAELHRKVNDLTGESRSVELVVKCNNQLGETDQALKIAEEALEKFSECEFRRGEASALELHMECLLAQDRPEEALSSGQDALTVAKELDDKFYEATLLHSLAGVYLKMRNFSEGLVPAKDSIQILRAEGRLAEEAMVRLDPLIHIHVALQQWQEATEAVNEALNIYRGLNDRMGEAQALLAGGSIFHRVNSYDEAQNWVQQAREIFLDLSENTMLVHTLYTLAVIMVSKDEPSEAVKLDREAHLLSQREKNKELEAGILIHTVQAHFAELNKVADAGKDRSSREFTDALTKAEKAAMAADKIAEKLAIPMIQGDAKYAVAEVHLVYGRMPEALQCADEAIKHYQAAVHQVGEGLCTVLKASVFKAQGRFQESLNASMKAMELGQAAGDQALQAEAQKNIEAIQGTQLQLPFGMMGSATMAGGDAGGEVVEAAAASSVVAEPEKPKGLDALMVGDLLHGMLREMVGVQMESDTPFMDAGVDSLMSIEFRSQVNQAFSGLGLASTLTFDYPTIRELTAHIVDKSLAD